MHICVWMHLLERNAMTLNISLRVIQGLLRNGCKSVTREQIWGRKLRRKHTSVEGSPPREALLACPAAPALLSHGEEQAGGSRILNPTIPSVMLSIMYLSEGESSIIKCYNFSLPVISKMSGFCAPLLYSLSHFAVYKEAGTHLFLKHLMSCWDMPCVGNATCIGYTMKYTVGRIKLKQDVVMAVLSVCFRFCNNMVIPFVTS